MFCCAPTAESLTWNDRKPPESVKEFLKDIIHATHHSPGDDVQRYVDSFAQDLVHAVSRGSFLTEKHVLLGTGLHSLTGLKKPMQILGRFGHCCNYDKIRLIETAQAELAQHLRSLENPLPLLPADDGDHVLTFFWWDNFDAKKENMQGSIHTTHGIAYQEESTNTVRASLDITIQESKSDTYPEKSIKNSERALREEGEEFVIKTPEIRIPPNFTSFLSNGTNKERLFELVEEVWVNNKDLLGTRTIYFARSDRCIKISNSNVETVEELQTNHEEADTKICCLLHFAMRNNGGQETSCAARSCSGDIDIPIILAPMKTQKCTY